MIFIINNSVLYNEEDGTLSHIDNTNNKIALLKPTSRLLSLFIRNNNELLLRERLINDVWVEHGLKASNNNLNNYVSGLRKSLAQFGIEEIIVTYPRQGFKFIALSIHKADGDKGIDTNKGNDIAEPVAVTLPNDSIINLRRLLQRLVMIAAACLVPFAIVVLYQNSTRINVYPLGSYEQCQIYSMRLGSGNVDYIKQMIRRAGFSCQKRADVYYYDNIRNEGTENTEQWLTFCPRSGNSPCINNYIDNKQS
ncbi:MULTISPECIES: winged helix-turn-helix domain-containing protein [Serratia]|uniref:winged helix-turn-helix domain-containing protein n=1 Tax=Serratia TaxID=613 RepID=UPI0018D65035|nr:MULTISPECIES: winged helix-turn-helix domain-containing protein [Serratia]MBH2653677.1 winged helix-turn-helix domain-containing protein [Serratia ureilytica]MBH2760522.1 winged helix-turn-helix domain-containing protein [Serratia ureilytica]MBH2883683.1 winged helix-turn-helix domain-containing protein [Serratia ureilytica]MBH2928058.1 winged helix-turn-helix domain-containing protein [Serratia ureilytica]MDP8633448.1 winged helix-turn-helix domain-containing protein [Serratia marcescens]